MVQNFIHQLQGPYFGPWGYQSPLQIAVITATVVQPAEHWVLLRWTPHPEIVTIRDSKDYVRVLLHSYYTTITRGGPPRYSPLGID